MKKRMRDSVGGEMKGFRDRLTSSKTSSYSLCDANIYIDQLQDLNIPVPQDGEVLDIVFIKPYTLQKSLKSSQKMHLLDYAIKTNQQLDHSEYVKQFATSTIRISMASKLPRNIDSLDTGT